jgi:hypothetical protein
MLSLLIYSGESQSLKAGFPNQPEPFVDLKLIHLNRPMRFMEPHSAVLGLENRTDRPHWRRTSLCAPIALRKWG